MRASHTFGKALLTVEMPVRLPLSDGNGDEYLAIGLELADGGS